MPQVDSHPAVASEQGLARQLSTAQQATMALGGAIGTGLFLASGLSVNVAGPAIILSYVIVAAVALLLTRALTEMAVAHPTARCTFRRRRRTLPPWGHMTVESSVSVPPAIRSPPARRG